MHFLLHNLKDKTKKFKLKKIKKSFMKALSRSKNTSIIKKYYIISSIIGV